MNPLTAYALGILTACGLSLLALGLLAYYDHREALKRRVERRGTYTPPDPPSPDHLVSWDEGCGPDFMCKGPAIVPMGVKEVREAQAETRLMNAIENIPDRGTPHIFAVDDRTAELFTNPSTAGPDAA